MLFFLFASLAFGQAKDPVSVMPFIGECSADLDGDGTTERALLIQTKLQPTRRLSLMIVDTKSLSVVWSQNTTVNASIKCTKELTLTMGEEMLNWKWNGKTYVFRKGAPTVATLKECPKHVTCEEYGLDGCMCDAKGALHTAEGMCEIRFKPPCPSGKSCDANKFQDDDCLEEMNDGMDGGMEY